MIFFMILIRIKLNGVGINQYSYKKNIKYIERMLKLKIA